MRRSILAENRRKRMEGNKFGNAIDVDDTSNVTFRGDNVEILDPIKSDNDERDILKKH